MKNLKFIVTIVCLFLVIISCNSRKQADAIYYNGSIYTVDSAFSVVEAMVIKNGNILAVGKSSDVLSEYDAKSKIDLKGQAIYPGFIDAHCHFFGYGADLVRADLYGTKSFEEVLERLIVFNKTNKFSWIWGRGWDQNDWAVKEFPTKEKLDSLFPSTPVYLMRIDGHAVLCNQKALDLASIKPVTKISGGEIVTTNGKLTGLLIDNAIELVKKHIPSYGEDIFRVGLKHAQENCFAAGLTSVCDAGLGKDSIELIDKMQREGVLKIKVYAMVSDVPDNISYYLQNGPYKTDRLNVRSFKIYADGALGSRGACLLYPYNDAPQRYGFMLTDSAHISSLATEAFNKGFQLNTHCIGDSATRVLLKIYADKLNRTNDRRWRIEHCQIVDPTDMHYFSENNIIASVQPTHATSDMYWAEDRLGAERIKTAYAYNDLMKVTKIVFGTDFPVENINPVHTFYAAVARKDHSKFPEGGFQPENKISRENTLKAMTIWAAYSCFEENEKGSLEKGKAADFIILDKDLMKIAEEDILSIKVLRTVVNGEVVFETPKQ